MRLQVLRGYYEQSEFIANKLDFLVGLYESRRESVIIEGVHLSVGVIVELMRRHPSVIPMIIFISNDNKHKERFAVRSKHMTLDARHNRFPPAFPSHPSS
jgi:2-phosphoglycerate kinase